MEKFLILRNGLTILVTLGSSACFWARLLYLCVPLLCSWAVLCMQSCQRVFLPTTAGIRRWELANWPHILLQAHAYWITLVLTSSRQLIASNPELMHNYRLNRTAWSHIVFQPVSTHSGFSEPEVDYAPEMLSSDDKQVFHRSYLCLLLKWEENFSAIGLGMAI